MKFQPEYFQFVPVFSSVKVDGEKLRVLARKYDGFEISIKDSKRIVRFYNKVIHSDGIGVNKISQEEKEYKKEIEFPGKTVKIYNLDLLNVEEITTSNLAKKYSFPQISDIISVEKYCIARIAISCSKGTYIRQLAIDIGEKLGVSAMLVGLRRTGIGDFRL